MISDAIDDALDDDLAEEETEDLTNQVSSYSCHHFLLSLFQSTRVGGTGGVENSSLKIVSW